MNKNKIPWSDLFAMAGLSILIFLILYSAFAIGNWDINPGNWNDISRGIFAGLVGIVDVAMILSFILFLNSDHNK